MEFWGFNATTPGTPVAGRNSVDFNLLSSKQKIGPLARAARGLLQSLVGGCVKVAPKLRRPLTQPVGDRGRRRCGRGVEHSRSGQTNEPEDTVAQNERRCGCVKFHIQAHHCDTGPAPVTQDRLW